MRRHGLRIMKNFTDPPRLKGLDFTKNQIEIALRNGQILRCSIELSKACNLRCPFCYADAGSKTDDELSLQRILLLIQEAKENGAQTITILGGEPLLFPKFKDVVSHVHSIGLTPLIFTNGTLMTPGLADFLYENGASIIVKYNSHENPAIQDDMVGGVVGTFEKIKKTLQILIDKKFNAPIPTRLGIETVMSQKNIVELPKIFRFARENGIYPYIELITPTGRGKNGTDRIDSGTSKDIFHQLLKIDETEYGHTWIPHPPHVASSCNYYFTSVYVQASGKTQPCPGVPIEIGNINQESLRNILDKQRTKQLRDIRTHIKGKCKSCPMSSFCYGCRSAAFHLTGDLYESDPICWVSC